jgi:HD-GYP domain-containing protein (c-di-GMP phosphodiesterase class II)
MRDAYDSAIDAARTLWRATADGGRPASHLARGLVETLVDLATVDGGAFVALATAQRPHQDRLPIHMVNVAALTVLQTASFGIGGPLLVECGMAGLLHDIGKTRTPRDILNKPGPLSPAEAVIMRRHVLDGEHILRTTPGMPPLVALVAFEHHLRHGYPVDLEPRRENVCTSIVVIADVFDALRADRPYHEGLPAATVEAIMASERTAGLDQPLLRHFCSLLPRYVQGRETLTVKSR